MFYVILSVFFVCFYLLNSFDKTNLKNVLEWFVHEGVKRYLDSSYNELLDSYAQKPDIWHMWWKQLGSRMEEAIECY